MQSDINTTKRNEKIVFEEHHGMNTYLTFMDEIQKEWMGMA